MSHHEYQEKGSLNGPSTVIEISGIQKSFERHYISIVFFTDDTYSEQVSTSLLMGSITIEASDNGYQFGFVDTGTGDTGQLLLGGTQYNRPSILGSISQIKLSFANVTSFHTANNFRVYINSHGG